MATGDSTIANLPSASSIAGTDVFPIDSGTTKKATIALLGSSLPFTPSGTGAVSRTVSATLQAIVRTGDYATAGNYTTALAALTETIGVRNFDVGGTAINLGTIGNSSGGENLRIRIKTTSGLGDFSIVQSGQTFNGVVDDILSIGFNAAGNGGRIDTAKAKLAIEMESDYFNLGKHAMEWNLNFVSPSGALTARTLYHVIERDTLAYIAWRYAIGTSTDGNSYFSVVNADATLNHFVILPGTGKLFYLDTSEQFTITDRSANTLFNITLTGDMTVKKDVVFTRSGPGAAVQWSDTARLIVPNAKTFTFSADGGVTYPVTISAGVDSTGAVKAFSGTAIPAAGTAGTGVTFSSTSNFGVFFGSGAPTLSAAKGSLYLRSDGTTTNDRAYINTNGTTTWTALTTAA